MIKNYFVSFAFILIFNVIPTNQQEFSQVVNFFKHSKYMIPHPDKILNHGEDALFSNENLLVVADGNGEWAKTGVDPGLYPKELCRNMGNLFTKDPLMYSYNSRGLIVKAHNLTNAIGSTTVCMMTLDQDELILRTANIGDSGFAIYRLGDENFKLIEKSKPQRKSLTIPFQIGSQGDSPYTAILRQHYPKPLDLVVMGTDGLFDNISDEMMILILNEDYKRNQDVDVQRLAKYIAGLAYRLSIYKNYVSPFSQMAKAYGLKYQGGKIDDITVIVAQINQQKQLKA